MNPSSETLLFSGSACLFRQAALAEVGLFDEAFFAYCEDADLGLRMLWSGWRIALAPDATVIHNYSATTGQFSLRKVFLVERNHLWVAVKNLPAPLLCALPFVTIWRYLLQARVVRRQSSDLHLFVREASMLQVVLAILAAYASFVAGLRRVVRQRRTAVGLRRLSSAEMARRLWRSRLPMREVL